MVKKLKKTTVWLLVVNDDCTPVKCVNYEWEFLLIEVVGQVGGAVEVMIISLRGSCGIINVILICCRAPVKN